ncbi:MAG: selenocysteine-specific translation elongation factor [Betaproteobacteria bacterium]|nr:selenocysteine-specific translation elongation factor [Betaproteobacteria bacterium]
MILATAGHIDHGKTTLVRTLTGVETDRLPEEKARGISIDLGFAHWHDPSGRAVSFIDVPGHERFIKNMLAGVSCIDAALLVVAADDGPMPQTREHLEILQLLAVDQILIALTKIDRVTPARIAEAQAEVSAMLAPTRYAGARILPIDAPNRLGLHALTESIAALLPTQSAQRDQGLFRMAIDRSFIAAGEGLVVTGTVSSGSLSVGQTIHIAPRGKEARVRGIRVAGKSADLAPSGARCAINLTGASIDRTSAGRGDWLVAPVLDRPTPTLDVELSRTVDEQALPQDSAIHAFLGTADVPGRLLLLDAPGTAGKRWARLRLDHPVHAVRGDRIVLRDASNTRTIVGATVLDPFPDSVRLKRAERIALLQTLSEATPATNIEWIAGHFPFGADVAALQAAWNLSDVQMSALVDAAKLTRVTHQHATRAIRQADSDAVATIIEATIDHYHATHPTLSGPDRKTLLGALGGKHRPLAIEHALQSLLATKWIVREGATFRRTTHRAKLAPADAKIWERLRPLINEGGILPPRVGELAEQLNLSVPVVQAILDRVCAAGDAYRVAPNRCFLRPHLHALATIAQQLATASADASFGAIAFRDSSGIGRNLTIEVLEFFDRAGLTKRHGNSRSVIGSADDLFGTT